MYRAILSILVLVPLLLIIFGAGAFTAMRLHFGEPIATINIKNETEQEIESISVIYTTCGVTRSLLYRQSEQRERPASDKEVLMEVVLCGEGGHRTEVVFRNGQVFSTRGSYIEGGSEVTEHIRPTGIQSEFTRSLL